MVTGAVAAGRDAGWRVGPGKREVWLALETATAVGSVAVWKGGLVFEQTMRIQGTHSERVLPALDHALSVTDTAAEEVTALVIGSGPGSFTGVRIAASLAKGWSLARGTPLFAYPSLLATAAGAGATGLVCALFDARRGQVYAACYELSEGGPPEEQVAPSAWRIDELLEELAARGLEPVFVGEGALAYRERILAATGGASILPEHVGIPRAASLLWLRSVAPELGRVGRMAEWEPLYVRDWRVAEERGRR
jgi:tRNA threonylcarbamoyladenosine biosynthesis protein TsaB